MDKLSYLTSLVYALVVIIGGIIGYLKAQSKMSLLTGIISGICIFLACKVGKNNPKNAYLFICAICFMLASVFIIRFAATHAFMPSGLMLILSTLVFVIVARGFFKLKK